MIRTRPIFILLVLSGAIRTGPAFGQASAPSGQSSAAQVTFDYENPQLQPAKYSFVIHEDGSGSFHSEPGATPPPDSASYHPLPKSLDRPVQLSRDSAGKIFAIARANKLFATSCEDGKGKIAFQGKKQLSFQGPEGSGSCTYNWSKNASIQKLTTLFESIAFTLEEGRRLDVEHKHDRLALDPELEALISAAKEGRAAELQTIQPVLQAIIEDEAVLERVRSRAAKLLR